MNKHLSKSPSAAFPFRAGNNPPGMVLLIVLCCLALLTILLVSFLTGANSEAASSKQYAAAVESQNLASSALNLAMGLVEEAARSDSNTVSWASQPGMIRNWDASGTAQTAVFKLYSARQMRLAGAEAAAFDPFDEAPPDDWNKRPAVYTDLNAPSGRELRFPIIDPRAMGQVSGFSYSAGLSNGGTLAGVVTSGDDDSRRLPMPVMWLYVLKDGSFVAPAGSSGTAASVQGATKDNPITGRIAFWTDDESCKVNINTAAEGSFWDTPMASFTQEGVLNDNFPAKNEFSRYAGHPATTSLSPVFPWLKGATTGAQNNAFYSIAPRIEQGGSFEGTQFAAGGGGVLLDADRLYDSVDELAFDKNRSLVNALSARNIEQRRFFLTAQSRSPEVTLFNTPRISVWPLHANANARHASERLIALASTTGAGSGRKEYFFSRATQNDPISDFTDATRGGRNKQIIAYLQDLTSLPVPGYGQPTFAQKWPSGERDQILISLYDYLRSGINLRTKVLNGAISSGSGAISYATDDIGHKGSILPTGLESGTALTSGHSLSTATRGFGRFPTIKEVSMLFACEKNADPAAGTPAKIWPALVVELFLPSQGPKPFTPNIKVTVGGLDSFRWEVSNSSGGPLTPRSMFSSPSKSFTRVSDEIFQAMGGISTGYISVNLLYYPGDPPNWADTVTNNPAGPSVDNWSPDFRFLGGTATITVELGDQAVASEALKQKFEITFPPMSKRLPNPKLWMQGTTALGTFTARISNNHAISTRVDGTFGGDIVKSMVVRHGDFRLVAAATETVRGGPASVASNVFVPHRLYDTGLPEGATPATHPDLYNRKIWPEDPLAPMKFNAHTIRGNPPLWAHLYSDSDNYVADPALPFPYFDKQGRTGPGLPGGAGPVKNSLGFPGDWDNGIGNTDDGPFINKPDEGLDKKLADAGYQNYMMIWNSSYKVDPVEEFFGPMRQIASPVMFGSLPSGAKRNRPWETLLFCPNPLSGWSTKNEHPGFASPPDHLLLDLFWMPVTEPYAISDPFSTAGKINMNSQIMPFTYITRNTGLRAVLENQKVTAFSEAIPWQVGSDKYMGYKAGVGWGPANFLVSSTSRFAINADETLKQFSERFATGKIFKSATEICEIFLVPEGFTLAQTKSASGFWSTHRITGDNMRERPYNAIYPRVTTRSNTYTVYVKAQSLKQLRSTLDANPATFTDGRDVVESEFQAAFTFERYLDPTAPAPEKDTDPLGPYKMRVISQRSLAW